jgi:hypothetical protein
VTNGSIAASKTRLARVIISPAVSSSGEVAVVNDSGSTTVGEACDFSACATAYTDVGGTIAQTQGEGLYTDATTSGAVTINQLQSKCTTFKFAQSLTGNVGYTLPSGMPGFWNVDASGLTLSGHTLTIGPSGGLSVSITAAQHIIYSDGINAHIVV